MGAEVLDDDVFRPGQRWLCAGEFPGKAPVAIVLRVEDDALSGRIVHLRIDGAGTPLAPWFVSHAPFTKAAARRSLYGPLGLALQVPDHAADYAAWREAMLAGRGLVFTVPVAEAVEELVRAARRVRGRPR
jgi:hypothetical protein